MLSVCPPSSLPRTRQVFLTRCGDQPVCETGGHAHAVVAVAAMPLELHARDVAELICKGLLKLILAVDSEVAQYLLRGEECAAFARNTARRGRVPHGRVDV